MSDFFSIIFRFSVLSSSSHHFLSPDVSYFFILFVISCSFLLIRVSLFSCYFFHVSQHVQHIEYTVHQYDSFLLFTLLSHLGGYLAHSILGHTKWEPTEHVSLQARFPQQGHPFRIYRLAQMKCFVGVPFSSSSEMAHIQFGGWGLFLSSAPHVQSER